MTPRVLRATPVVILAAAQASCSAVRVAGPEPGADPYAACADLGDIALKSASRSDAQDRMEARVRELGGDTLLFGERGRSRRLDEVPEEIVKRRDELRPPPETKNGRTRVADAATVDAQLLPGELWYYGAALRCNDKGRDGDE